MTAVPRHEFEARLGFPLDDFQHRALDALDAGRSVLIAAPTGSGKTVVAEYAVARAIAEHGKAFYTTPLKALSNQKFGDFARAYGSDRVGLLTGDNSVNPNAPIVVMTTEVLRNMIYAASDALNGLRYVVLDEVHYLQDPYRGAVWEEVIIHLPPGIDLVCLSATVSNAEEVAAWIETVRGETEAVIEERRPVELEQHYLVGERDTHRVRALPMFLSSGRPNPEAAEFDARAGRSRRRRFQTPGRVETLEHLHDEQMLPAIEFIFSRAGCDRAVDECLAAGVRLTDREARAAIVRIADAHTAGLSDDDLAVLGYARWRAGLEEGVASHHAGLVPPMKEAVEEAFAAGLLKIVYATETLALGINMPARTVVIERLTKFTGERHEFLTPGEYTQLTGRAGRRGIDEVGHSVVWWSPFVTFDQVAGLASRRTYALTSSFRPNYNMAANLVRRYDRDRAHHLLNLSFAQFHADRNVVELERELERAQEKLALEREAARSSYGDIDDYRRWASERRRPGREGLARLKPGDIVLSPRRGGRLVVLGREGRGGARVLAVTEGGELVRLAADDFDRAPEPLGHVELPVPFAPRRLAFRRDAAAALRQAQLREPAEAERPSSHPVEDDPELSRRLRAADRVDRLAMRVERLERRVRSRSKSLARQLDRVLSVLDAWGYVDGWQLTDAGALLTHLYSESDLLIAESLRQGLLDGLTAPELAALVSCFTYERRGADDGDDRRSEPMPTAAVTARVREIERLARDLNLQERDARLPQTRGPDPGITTFVHAWASGADLASVLDGELTGGDFVRHLKQCIDLLRQVADAAPDPVTAATARGGAAACQRGVVAASGLVG